LPWRGQFGLGLSRRNLVADGDRVDIGFLFLYLLWLRHILGLNVVFDFDRSSVMVNNRLDFDHWNLLRFFDRMLL
jgi:hypothetical protein